MQKSIAYAPSNGAINVYNSGMNRVDVMTSTELTIWNNIKKLVEISFVNLTMVINTFWRKSRYEEAMPTPFLP